MSGPFEVNSQASDILHLYGHFDRVSWDTMARFLWFKHGHWVPRSLWSRINKVVAYSLVCPLSSFPLSPPT